MRFVGVPLLLLLSLSEARDCGNADVQRCWFGMCSSISIPDDCTRLHLNTDTLLRDAVEPSTLVAAFPVGPARLAELRIETVRDGDAVAIAVAELLKVNTLLTNVELFNAGVSDAGAKAIADTLAANTRNRLESLRLHRNRIGNAGAAAIASALATESCALKTLELQSNRIGYYGAVSIGEALKTNAALETLRLNKNHIGDMGAKALAAASKVNFGLVFLDARDNQVHAKGVMAAIQASVAENKVPATRAAKKRRADGQAALGELCFSMSDCKSGSCKTRCCNPNGHGFSCLECGNSPAAGDCTACGEGTAIDSNTTASMNDDGSVVTKEIPLGYCRKQTARERKLVRAAEVAADEHFAFQQNEAARIASGSTLAGFLEQEGQDTYHWTLTAPFEFQTDLFLPVDHAVVIKAKVVGKAGITVGVRTEAGRDYGMSLSNCCHNVAATQRANAAETQTVCIPEEECTPEDGTLILVWDPARKSAPFSFQANITARYHPLYRRVRMGGRVRLYAHFEPGSHLQGLTVLSKENAFIAEMYRKGASKANAAGDGTADNQSCLRREKKMCFASNHDVCCGEACWPVCTKCASASTVDRGFCMCFPYGYYRDGRHVSPGGACLMPPGEAESDYDDSDYVAAAHSEFNAGGGGGGVSDSDLRSKSSRTEPRQPHHEL